MKLTSEDFKRYTQWQRHILGSSPRIPRECRRPTLIAYCLALAFHGTQGLDCYASNALLAREIGISRRHITKYRQLAIELGWFRPNGIRRNRVDSVDIHIPSVQVDVTELAGEVAPEAVTKDAPAPRREWWNSVPDPSEPDPWADEVVTSDSQPTEPAKLLRGDT